MSTSENPETPPLTRRQLRELRNTGATPIINPQFDADDAAPTEPPVAAVAADAPAAAAEPPAEEAPSTAPEAAEPEAVAAEPEAPSAEPEAAQEAPAKKGGMFGGLFGRGKAEAAPVDETPAVGAEPAPVSAPPIVPASFPPADGSDLGVTGLTRRQARAQERIRTASVPIIAPDLESGVPAVRDETPAAAAPAEPVETDTTASETGSADAALVEATDTTEDVSPESEAAEVTEEPAAPLEQESPAEAPAIFRPAAPEEAPAAETEAPLSTVNPALGSDLLSGQTPGITLPPSFDQLISRGGATTGSVSTPNALILSQTPAGVPLVGPVTSTGEVLITGTFELPEGLGSAGHAPGTTDGRDVDAVLLDGELPPASSPTPIAASAAISTVKQPGEIIRPPAPEKGSKLVIGLIITTGALAVAVAVALVLAFTTGVFG
ncbi:hypothetical protein ACF044_11245 [Microbacterium sp. NPDC016588]